jgi:sterol desaturase/sphingolipid hydroxylase (fatty acid hydroxylase superfamily)
MTSDVVAGYNNTTRPPRLSRQVFRRQVTTCRRLSAALVASVVIIYIALPEWVERVQSSTTELCRSLYAAWWFRHSAFEPLLASTVFAMQIAKWAWIDHRLSEYIPYLKLYRISQDSDSLAAWRGRSVAAKEEVVWYLVPWVPFGCVYQGRGRTIAHFTSSIPSLSRVLVDAMAALLVYDLLFFVGHYVMHRSSRLYTTVHAKHHSERVIRAGDAVRHSFWDGTFDVACSVIALNVLGIHPLSRALYNIVAVSLIAEAHCGSDFPWMIHNIMPCGLLAGPRVHDLHHRLHNKNFAKFFTHLDYMCGTLQDTEAISNSS